MSYNDYKQQYAYGFAPVALSGLGTLSSASAKFFLGEAFGPKAGLSKTVNGDGTTKPIDFKADKQMFHMKAVLDIEVIESIATEADCKYVKLDFMSADEDELDGYITAGYTGLAPDMTVYVKLADAVVCNTPYFQSLMPSNTKQYSWVEISVPEAAAGASVAFTSGKILAHLNPNV